MLLLPLPPVMASQIPETEGRKSLRERFEGLEQKMGGLKDDDDGNGNGEEMEGESKVVVVVGLRLWIIDMDIDIVESLRCRFFLMFAVITNNGAILIILGSVIER